jgi:hypothetical protein
VSGEEMGLWIRLLLGSLVGATLGLLLYVGFMYPLLTSEAPDTEQAKAVLAGLRISSTGFPWVPMLVFGAAGAAWGTGRRKG